MQLFASSSNSHKDSSSSHPTHSQVFVHDTAECCQCHRLFVCCLCSNYESPWTNSVELWLRILIPSSPSRTTMQTNTNRPPKTKATTNHHQITDLCDQQPNTESFAYSSHSVQPEGTSTSKSPVFCRGDDVFGLETVPFTWQWVSWWLFQNIQNNNCIITIPSRKARIGRERSTQSAIPLLMAANATKIADNRHLPLRNNTRSTKLYNCTMCHLLILFLRHRHP